MGGNSVPRLDLPFSKVDPVEVPLGCDLLVLLDIQLFFGHEWWGQVSSIAFVATVFTSAIVPPSIET